MSDLVSLAGKKLLILGGNPETGVLVKIANTLDIFTIVIDPNSKSPAKQFAKKILNFLIKIRFPSKATFLRISSRQRPPGNLTHDF